MADFIDLGLFTTRSTKLRIHDALAGAHVTVVSRLQIFIANDALVCDHDHLKHRDCHGCIIVCPNCESFQNLKVSVDHEVDFFGRFTLLVQKLVDINRAFVDKFDDMDHRLLRYFLENLYFLHELYLSLLYAITS